MPRQVRTSAKAVIIRGGKLVTLKLRDGDEEWYILPGGGQDSEETLPEAVEREVREEAGINVRCGDLLFAIEGVHGEDFHRVDLVFAREFLGEFSGDLHRATNHVGGAVAAEQTAALSVKTSSGDHEFL